MKVVLRSDVDNLGKKGDLVDVAASRNGEGSSSQTSRTSRQEPPATAHFE